MANPILILAEQLRGEVADISYELLGLGRKLDEDARGPKAA